jgi:hypothetical protein
VTVNIREQVPAAAAALALISGCAGLPPVDETRTVSLQAGLTGYGGLQVDVDGDPDIRPGALAEEGLQAAVEACYFLFLACALVTVPAGAAAGAIATAVETLPEEQAHALNHVTAKVAPRLALNADFQKAMYYEAARQGITLVSSRADVALSVYATEIFWDVSVGNNVAIEVHFEVIGRANGKSGRRNVRYVSDKAKVHEWVAGTGELIEGALTTMVEEASVEIWQEILGRDSN